MQAGPLVGPSLLTGRSSSLSCWGLYQLPESPALFCQRGPGFFVNNQPSVPRIADVLGRKDAEERRVEAEWTRERDRLWNIQCAQHRAQVAAQEQGKSLSKRKRRGLRHSVASYAKAAWQNRVRDTRSF